MPLTKQTVQFNFAQGVDSLVDPKQLPVGKFTSLQNTTFVKAEGLGQLNKRYGFDTIGSFSNAGFLTSFKGGLVGVGESSMFVYSNSISANVGYIQPLSLSVLPLNRSFDYPSAVDSTRSPNGLIAYVYRKTDYTSNNSPTFLSGSFLYCVVDGYSGQQLIPPTAMPAPPSGTQVYPAKIFSLNGKFVITYDGTVGSYSAAISTLNYFTIDQSTLSASAPQVFTANYRNASSASIQVAHDGFVANSTLFLSAAGSASVQAGTINSAFVASAMTNIATGTPPDMVSVTVDTSSATTVFTSWAVYKDNVFRTIATDQSFVQRWGTKVTTASSAFNTDIVNLTSASLNGNARVFAEIGVQYQYATSIPFNGVISAPFTTTGSTSGPNLVYNSLGLASKAFTISSQICFLSMYYGPQQSTYFLVATSGTSNNIIGKMAYGNAYAQYNLPATPNYVLNLPSASVVGSSAQIAYLETITIQDINKAAAVTGSNTSIYSTPGINVSTWTFGTDKLQSAEIEKNLHVNGGFLWMYDGTTPVEHNFHLYPDNLRMAVTPGAGGRMAPQLYNYQVVYRWQDAQGNIHRSAPSVPLAYTASSGTGSASLNIPIAWLTAKPLINPITVDVYRWSQAQQVFYKLPTVNPQTAGVRGNQANILPDVWSDSDIQGQEIIYTNGGVLENIGLPAVNGLALFDSRAWAISAEDENVLFFGKPGVQSQPAEMSDLLTYYVPDSVSGVPVPGGAKAIYGMDDKLLIFKRNAIMYINGQGPDATGAQNGYSQPILISNGIGCTNPNSLVLTPNGVMFQSDKGIWQVGRDLTMNFIGKDVQKYSECPVKAAMIVPGTNEARFTLGSSGQTLVYDYIVGQWEEQADVPGIAASVYKDTQAILHPDYRVSIQSKSGYADNGTPTVMRFTTGWLNLAGLQGYQRVYDAYLLGKFSSPHTYTIGVAYDYNPEIVQTATINPTNSIGSGSQIEQWEINFKRQQCQSVQLTFTEISSSSAGAGLSLSGVKIVYGAKKGYPGNIGVRQTTG